MLCQRILIAEDHAIFREGIRALLLTTPELQIIGEAEDGQEAISLTSQLKPHLVLMDLNLPKKTDQRLYVKLSSAILKSLL